MAFDFLKLTRFSRLFPTVVIVAEFLLMILCLEPGVRTLPLWSLPWPMCVNLDVKDSTDNGDRKSALPLLFLGVLEEVTTERCCFCSYFFLLPKIALIFSAMLLFDGVDVVLLFPRGE